jgi:hypothetical protein
MDQVPHVTLQDEPLQDVSDPASPSPQPQVKIKSKPKAKKVLLWSKRRNAIRCCNCNTKKGYQQKVIILETVSIFLSFLSFVEKTQVF